MITAQDIEFHTPADVNHEWAETNYFGFYIPGERLLGSIYTVARAGTGACVSDIIIYGSLAPDRMEVLHFDVAQHLPLPGSLLDYELPNGLHVKAVNAPRDYRIDYIARNGTRIHLDCIGLMDPFDIHDPAMNVRAQGSAASKVANSGFGAGYSGHFDQTGHVKGELVLGGRSYKIDCIDTMDHSWGPRAEYNMKTMCWMHAHFGKQLSVHMILQFTPFAPPSQQYQLAHGYVLRDGKVHSLSHATVRADRLGLQGIAMELEVTDSSGATLAAHGAAIAGAPWPCYLSLHPYNTLHRWTTPDGRVGYGVVQDVYSVEAIAERNLKARLA